MNDISNLKEFNETTTDLSEFEGMRIPIDSVEKIEVNSKFNPRGRQWVLKISTSEVTTIETADGTKDVRASELLNLRESADGLPVGWSSKGNLRKLLTKQKVNHPNDLIGKHVVVRLKTKLKDDGSNIQFLGFLY